MKYKALMLDIDGTLVPYDYDALPSKVVVSAVKKAKKKVHICVVSGRAYGFVTQVLKHLGITDGYAVVNNGANVVEVKTEKLLYDQPITKAHADEIVALFRRNNIPFFVKQTYKARAFTDGPFKPDAILKKAYMFYCEELYTEKQIDNLLHKLSPLSDLAVYKAQHKIPGKFGLNISHAAATKLHGVEIVMKQLGLKKEEIIGVGDGDNDFPLLMASGLKVAMGNAMEDLKAIADYVAPSVEEDGVADVINRFILNKV